ncbi:hypothetical protein HH308_14265 [Gordonia sp. TBRC 11910]|uniref:Uncharacterized protein n=1 Tax=Gordonia asplenii TaxID=2725283 RepID=A0A848KVS1_9ACTN|nr:hypothetical protein [Gordonia asplenii]NMO02379.1 hypothetical protein [Gordonia asplenii]
MPKSAEARIEHYWRVEQDGTVIAHELSGDAYAVVATVRPGTSWTAIAPFTVTLTPSDLVS